MWRPSVVSWTTVRRPCHNTGVTPELHHLVQGRYNLSNVAQFFFGGPVMTITIEATVENGQLKLKDAVTLAEGTAVRVVITPVDEDYDPFEAVIGICDDGPDHQPGRAPRPLHLRHTQASMIFVDTWAWLALAHARDPYHSCRRSGSTSRFRRPDAAATSPPTTVLAEIDLRPVSGRAHLQRSRAHSMTEPAGSPIQRGPVAARARLGRPVRSERACAAASSLPTTSPTSPSSISPAWSSCRTSASTDVFTGDAHFQQMNLGFRLLP